MLSFPRWWPGPITIAARGAGVIGAPSGGLPQRRVRFSFNIGLTDPREFGAVPNRTFQATLLFTFGPETKV